VSRRLLPALVAALACALTPALAGCGFGPGEAKPGAVALRVTRDFGHKQLGVPVERDQVRDSDTVMRLLQSTHNVTTRYGGAFVQSIDGLQGNKAGEHDWFFYVNGSESSVGAADADLSQSDVVQWDYHRWTATMHVPAIVGAFPEPFLHGRAGRRLPTRVECVDPDAKACDDVIGALERQHVTAAISPLGSAAGQDALRVIVGRWDDVRESITARLIVKGPAASGVFADVSPDGALTMLDGAGRPARQAPPGSGLLASTQSEGEGPVWIVTGADDAGVERAAAALVPAKLRNAFAVAATPSGLVRLPAGGF
jgi:hypothetical protein